MPRARIAPLLILGAAVAVLLWLRRPSDLPGANPATARLAPSASDDPRPGVPRIGEDAAEGTPSAPSPLPISSRPSRVAAAVTAPPAGPPSAPSSGPEGPPIDPWVMGVVTDADGWAIPGVEVLLRRAHQAAFPGGEFRGEARAEVSAANVTVVTDRRGSFLFEGQQRSLGGTLAYGQGILVESSLTQEVDPAVDWQVLRLPPFEAQAGRWTIEVVDEDGAPLEIARVDLEPLEVLDTGSVRWPWPYERTVETGRVVQSALPLGTWSMVVTPQDALAQTVSWTHEAEEHERTDRIVVPREEMGLASETGPTLEPDGSSWVDPGSGLLEWLPEDRVTVGEPALNRHFAQTLRFGAGPIRGARLTIRLRAMLFNASNDGLYLEHTGGRKFAWSSAIASLTGGSWSKGNTRTVRLDLTALPQKGGGTLDLRPWLEDGALDVMVQDDTTIEDIRIRVLR